MSLEGDHFLVKPVGFCYQHYKVFFQEILGHHFLQHRYQVCKTQLKDTKELRSPSFEITCRFYFSLFQLISDSNGTYVARYVDLFDVVSSK